MPRQRSTTMRMRQHWKPCSGRYGHAERLHRSGSGYIACGYTDPRLGIDGLAALVQRQFALDPFENCLFLFCGRKRGRIKALYWGQRLSSHLQASGVRQIPMAPEGKRSQSTHDAAAPLAHWRRCALRGIALWRGFRKERGYALGAIELSV